MPTPKKDDRKAHTPRLCECPVRKSAVVAVVVLLLAVAVAVVRPATRTSRGESAPLPSANQKEIGALFARGVRVFAENVSLAADLFRQVTRPVLLPFARRVTFMRFC
jgi:hypothetical protein